MEERIAQETRILADEHSSCPAVKYERDYSATCPDGWESRSDGSCWGQHYRGPCEAMQSFRWFTAEDKKRFEHRCCAFWPAIQKRKRAVPISVILNALHGSVSFEF